MQPRISTAIAKRFELPVLDFNWGKITDGTDIPPPLDPPVAKAHHAANQPGTQTLDVKNSNTPNSVAQSAPENGNLVGTKRAAEDTFISPVGSSRQGSLRRFFSRATIDNNHAEGQLRSSENGSVTSSSLPGSQSGLIVVDERKLKRGSTWFKRLKAADQTGRRASLFSDDTSRIVTPRDFSAPPPPMIPELDDLKNGGGSLGNDLFNHIK